MAKTYGAEDLEGRLEPEANQPGHNAVECMLVSIAISLKRIADAMDEKNEYGEGPAAAIGGAITRSLQQRL